MRITKPVTLTTIETTYQCDMCGCPIGADQASAGSMIQMQWQFSVLNYDYIKDSRDFRLGGTVVTKEVDLCAACRKIIQNRLKNLFTAPEPKRTQFELSYITRAHCLVGSETRILCKTDSLAEVVTWLVGGADRFVRIIQTQGSESGAPKMFRHPADLLRAYQSTMENREVEARKP